MLLLVFMWLVNVFRRSISTGVVAMVVVCGARTIVVVRYNVDDVVLLVLRMSSTSTQPSSLFLLRLPLRVLVLSLSPLVLCALLLVV